MSGGDPSGALHDMRTLFSNGVHGGLTDRQLLDRFVNRSDSSAEDAFTILLERHGPMVWGVCRRLLPDRYAAADAFQATFLVLVRRASAVKVDDSLGPWLYGVSRRVAARARANSLRRGARETGGVEALAGPVPEPGRDEWRAILDEEIGRLPERQRAAVVLCDLEGLPHEEAARRLGCPVGTVESRLTRGRQRLRDRLVRRGLAPAAAALWAEMAREASAAMPVGLIEHSARFVTSSPAAGAVPAAVAALAEGVIQMMWLARLKPLVAVAAALILATAGVAVQGRQQPAAEGAREQAKTAPPPAAGAGGAGVPDIAANQALAREQLTLIDNALVVLHKLAQNGRIRVADPSFSLWGRRKLETLRKTGAGKAEIIAALEKYINSLKEEEVIVEAMRQSARGTQVDVYDVQFRRMEAEIWLNEEKAR
ncbi:MAG: sigma-70 family RNA polymerase sigma factor [Isosphaeraceae bacterium]|nr:sigma-70 family RNA polymerase sigma factor [Isosphaeraceae bacterium]